ncbi:MAG: LamG domain-containing protein [Phycisphaerae bacterium]|jgi:hypothetical protein
MRTTLIFAVVLISVLSGFVYAGIIDAPISHWTLDETSGATVHDSADSHNGAIAGDPVWTAGKIDGCLDFDSSGDYVNFGDVSQFEFGGNDFTIAFWFKTEGAHDIGGENSGTGNIISKYDINLGRQWLIQQTADDKIHFDTYSVDSSTGGDGLVSTGGYGNEWTYVTAVRQGAAKYLYINGVLDNNGVCNGIVAGTISPVLIGARSANDYYYRFFNGKIDDVRIYDYALSAAEANQLYLIPEPATIALLGLGALSLIRKNRLIKITI